MIFVSQMKLERGTPIKVTEYCTLRQPLLGDIEDVGYDRYQGFLSAFLISKAELLKSLGAEDGPEFDAYTLYDLIAAIPELRANYAEALAFFVIGGVSHDQKGFYVGSHQLTKEELQDIAAAVMQAAYIEMDEESQHVFASEKARRVWEKCKKGRAALRKENKKDVNMELPNLIGAVAARGCGYNLLNIWDLTVYQLHDQFARMNVSVQMDIYSSRWAAWGKDDFDVSLWFKDISKKEGMPGNCCRRRRYPLKE